jgi:hypothetical protein
MVPDPELIRPYALESCKTCANFVDSAEWLAEHKSRYDVEPTSVGASVVLPESPEAAVRVRVLPAQEASRIPGGDGAVVRRYPHVSGQSELALVWRSSSWLVQYVKDVPK